MVFYGITLTGNGTVISNGQTFALQRDTVVLTSYFSIVLKPENILRLATENILRLAVYTLYRKLSGLHAGLPRDRVVHVL